MTFKDMFSQQIKMIPLENTFKQLHEQFPERNLQLPHSSEYVGDILKLASQKTGNSFPNKLLENRLEEELFFRTGGDPEVFDFVFYAYREFLRNHQYKERFLNNIVGAFFIILLRNHGSNVIVPEADSQGHDENVIFLLKYMQENYTSITLKDLADFFNYSERQIQRIIKNCTGMSFSQNIQKLKMRRAARLLTNPDLSVSAIAEELGYMDSGNFRHIFKKYYGMTPAEYREKK